MLHANLVHCMTRADSLMRQCEQCDKAFNKHHQLRSHIAEAHSPEGTKPFLCEHEGCDLSFATGAKLRTHQKVHEGESKHID